MIRAFLHFLLAILFSLLIVASASAAVVTWDGGGGGDTNWGTCANWSGDSCPTSSDIATFDSTSTNNSVIATTLTGSTAPAGIDINSGYTGTITQNSGVSITIGASNFDQAAGTFAGGDSSITLNGTYTLSSGTFTSTSGTLSVTGTWTHTLGGTFNHNSGTVTASGAVGKTWDVNVTETFFNFTINKTGTVILTISSGDTFTVNNTVTLTDGKFNTGTLNAKGATVSVAAAWDGGNGTLLVDGSITQTVTLAADSILDNITVNNASATVQGSGSGTLTMDDTALQLGTIDTTGFTVSHTGTVTISGGTYTNGTGTKTFTGTFSQSNGTFNGNSATLDFNNAFSLSGGTFNATSGSMLLDDTWTHTSGGTFNHNSGTVTADGAVGKTWDVNVTETFFNFTLNKTGTVTLTVASGDTLSVTGTLTLTDGKWATGTLDAQGDMSVGVNFDTSGGLLKISGSATQTLTFASGVEAILDGDVTVNKSGGAANLGSAMTLNASGQDLTIQEGTLDLNGFTLTVSGAGTETLIVETGGNLQLQGGETLTADSASYPQLDSGSKVTYDGTAGPYTIKDYTYHHLTISGSGAAFSMGANETLGGDLTVTAGTFDVNDTTLSINGNTLINGGTLKSGTSTVTFGDAGADTVTISSGTFEIESDTPSTDIVKTAGTWTNSGGTIIYNAATGISVNLLAALEPYFNLTINSSGSTYSLTEATDIDATVTLTAGTLDVSSSSHAMTVGGGWTDTGAGTFTEQNGTVTFDGTGTLNSNEAFENITVNTAGAVTLGADLDADGTLTLTAGTLDVSSTNYGITVGGNWAKTGTFTQRSGTVTFDTAGTVSTISGSTTFFNFTCATAGKSLTFTAATTQTISGTLTLTGASGNLIVLRSSVDGSTWNLTVSGTSSVDFVNVKDSNAGGGNAITHAVSSTRSTNAGNNTNWSFNVAPTVATVTAVQSSIGDGDVTITFIVDDADDDNTLQAKVEYSLNGGSSWNDPTLSTTNSETTASVAGDPSINNAANYQVGQSGAFILTSSGANTISIVWEAGTDIVSTTDISNAKIRITPYDATVEGTAGSSSNFILDRVAPSTLANFIFTDFSSSRAVFSWTAASDSNFNHYEIWHGENESQVTSRSGSAIEWDNDNDATLTTASTVTSIINNTDPRNKYFKIFAIDNYGNELTVTGLYISGGQSSSDASSNASTDTSQNEGPASSDEETEEQEAEQSSGEESSGDENSSTSTSTSITENEGDSSSSADMEQEEVKQEAEELSDWDDFEIEVQDDHWSSGYVKHLEEQSNIVEVAVSQPTFLEILMGIFTTPNESMSRSNALEFLLVLSGYSLDTMIINIRDLAFEDLSLDDERAGFIQFAYDQGLIQGYPDGTFKTDQVVNRAEALKLCSYFFEGENLGLIYGEELLELHGLSKNPFLDVDLEAWYAPYLINAYANGVVSGYGDGTFGPGNPVTYAEFLKIATLMQNFEHAIELAEELEFS